MAQTDLDEIIERPGIRIARKGRSIEWTSKRSPEEQKELNKRMWESRPEILEEIKIRTTELLDLIHKYSSLDLVANLFIREGLQNPDTYVESESRLRPHWVEHAALLELKDSSPELRHPPLVEGADLERAHQLLEEIFAQTNWYYIAESADPSRNGPPTKIDQLRFMTLIHGMSVRSPAYSSHWRSVLLGLFGSGHAIEKLSDEYKLDIQSALTIIDAIEDYITSALNQRLEKAQSTYQDFFERLKRYRSTGVFDGDPNEKELFDRIRNMRRKEAKQYLKYALVEWTRVALGTVLSFDLEQLANTANVNLEKAQAFVTELSIEFGRTPADYLLPSPVNALHERPIIHHTRGEFCPAPHLLPWAVKPAFERALKQSSYWHSYERHRSSYLIKMGLKYFQDLLPGAIAHESLYYPLKSGEETELDGILFFDRYAFLIEAKAGSFGAARRGGKEKIKSQLAALVGDAADQVIRARDYVRRTDQPIFKLKTGETVCFDKTLYTEVVLVTLTLDVLDIFTAGMHQMRDIGIVTSHDLPWSIALTDLRCISEIIRRPFELTHYLRWRISMIDDPSVSVGVDELNWLGVYLKEGPKRLSPPSSFKQLTMLSYTDDFDAYFLYKEGARTIPAPRPAQPLPSPLNLLCDSLVSCGMYGFTQLGEILLDLSFADRQLLAEKLIEFSFKEKKGCPQEILIQTNALTLNLAPAEYSLECLSGRATEIRQQTCMKTVILRLTALPDWQVLGWVQD